MAAGKNCVIWRVTDGKRGHENQSAGLTQALAELLPVESHTVPAPAGLGALCDLAMRRFPAGTGLPDPALIIGAGRATRTPRACFDLCLIPAHDGIESAPNVLVTRGALNTVRPSAVKDAAAGLMLLGGESRHYLWDDASIVAQVQDVAQRAPQMQWTLTDSRRTPAGTVARLKALALDNLQFVPHQGTPSGWLPARLADAAQAWVTPDSVSMVYEALTSGAAVGLFDLQGKGSGRVTRGVEALAQEGLLTAYGKWAQGVALQPPREEFDEAARCARWIRDRWFPGN